MITPPTGMVATSVSRGLESPGGDELQFEDVLFARESSKASFRIP
jgi:hypothetical protein